MAELARQPKAPAVRDGITVAEACGLMGVHRQTWWRHRDDPGWPPYWTIGRAVRMSRAAVLAFIAGRQKAAAGRRRELAAMAQP